MDTDRDLDEGRHDEACRDASRRALSDPDLWALVVILLVLLALMA